MTRRENIYDYIIKHKIEHRGNSPSIRAIMAALDIPSTSNVGYHLDILADQGAIDLVDGQIECGEWRLAEEGSQ